MREQGRPTTAWLKDIFFLKVENRNGIAFSSKCKSEPTEHDAQIKHVSSKIFKIWK